ncbi:AN1-type zinc finger protein 1 [Tyrophagus putrescentiae]|nr:AN1-type zinc finger protein 1 [Tyrophagus putrescentiae]
MAEIPDLGKHCAVCNLLDHATAIAHKCTPSIELQKVDLKKRGTPNPADYAKCAFCSTTVSILESITCLHCRGRFCLTHRHKADHDCESLGKASPDEVLAQAALQQRKTAVEGILQKLQSSGAGVTVKNRGKKNDALAQRVAAMKLKSTAAGQASIPEEERIYFSVSFVPNEPLSFGQEDKQSVVKERPIFLCREWTVGRCVDWIAAQFSLVNRNNEPKAAKLVLTKQELLEQGSTTSSEAVVRCCSRNADNLHLCFSHELKELESAKVIANTDRLLVTYFDL